MQDIFTPRIEIVSISTEMTNEEIENVFLESGYSRLPVHNGDVDQISGVLYQKDFYRLVVHGKKNVEDVVWPAIFASKHKKIGDLLKELQQAKQHIAIVIDEFGCTAGLVTMEDILEEIVGDIWDEYDTVSDDIQTLEDGSYQVNGTCNVEELFEFLGKKLKGKYGYILYYMPEGKLLKYQKADSNKIKYQLPINCRKQKFCYADIECFVSNIEQYVGKTYSGFILLQFAYKNNRLRAKVYDLLSGENRFMDYTSIYEKIFSRKFSDYIDGCSLEETYDNPFYDDDLPF